MRLRNSWKAVLKDCERTGQEDSGQVVEALIPLTKGHTFFFFLTCRRVVGTLEGDWAGELPCQGWTREICTSVQLQGSSFRPCEKWFVSEQLEKSWLMWLVHMVDEATTRDTAAGGWISSFTPNSGHWRGWRWSWGAGLSRTVKLCLGSAGGVLWSLSDVCHAWKDRGQWHLFCEYVAPVVRIYNAIGDILGIGDKPNSENQRVGWVCDDW